MKIKPCSEEEVRLHLPLLKEIFSPDIDVLLYDEEAHLFHSQYYNAEEKLRAAEVLRALMSVLGNDTDVEIGFSHSGNVLMPKSTYSLQIHPFNLKGFLAEKGYVEQAGDVEPEMDIVQLQTSRDARIYKKGEQVIIVANVELEYLICELLAKSFLQEQVTSSPDIPLERTEGWLGIAEEFTVVGRGCVFSHIEDIGTRLRLIEEGGEYNNKRITGHAEQATRDLSGLILADLAKKLGDSHYFRPTNIARDDVMPLFKRGATTELALALTDQRIDYELRKIDKVLRRQQNLFRRDNDVGRI